MRKWGIVAAMVGALVSGGVGMAVAGAAPSAPAAEVGAAGVAGPFKTLDECEKVRKAYADKGYQVGACSKTEKGFVFKYA